MTAPQSVDLDGALVSPEEAAIPTTDLGLLYGIGLFETMRAYRGRVFRLERHLQRLMNSAQALGLPISADILPDARRCARLLQANGLTDARLRLTVTGGSRTPQGVRHSVLTTAIAVEPYPEEYYANGVTVRVTAAIQDSQDPLQGHKTTAYWNRLQALHEAQVQGCVEALWMTEKRLLAEGSISNVFVVSQNTVHTPPCDTPVLPGVTREAVLELCEQMDIAVRETPVEIDGVLDADELFITNCMMAVVPVVRVERHAIGTEKPGPVTKRIGSGIRGPGGP